MITREQSEMTVPADTYMALLELRANVRLLADPDGTYAAIGEVHGDANGYIVAKLRAVVRELHPDAWVPRLNRWLRDRHRPLDVGDDDHTMLCSSCSNGWTGKTVEWPCAEYVRLDKRMQHPA